MPDTPTDPKLDPKQAQKITPGPRKNLEKPPTASNWQFVWWYIPVMLLMLWLWQDQLNQISVKTIPYSQFKQYLAAGEVAECRGQGPGDHRADRSQGRPHPNRPPPAAGKSDEAKPLAAPEQTSHPAAPGKSSAASLTAEVGRIETGRFSRQINAPGRAR